MPNTVSSSALGLDLLSSLRLPGLSQTFAVQLHQKVEGQAPPHSPICVPSATISVSATRGNTTAERPYPSWVADSGRPHPDAWSPLSTTSTEIRAIR